MNLSKEFDSVNHNLLLAELKDYGFSLATVTSLIREYLKERRQRVKTEGICSEWNCVKAGVPRRSLFGPLLFNIYTNDVNLIKCPKHGTKTICR